jgi:hypothetical protein
MQLLILEQDEPFGAAIGNGRSRTGGAVKRTRNGVERPAHAQTDQL